ncbi:hypothetical protein [Lactiplantibacillus plajomi]|uniref:Integral membrane protein n=1 Tax=Lactiplantibacillus plajomi TaxID=1457217 RepID=A0ABV6K3D7_9LACO|nr:hypothetical protein [Lactiplantibacillus plajomi]
MKWHSIWRHTRYILNTLIVYFLLIQGPYDLWIGKTGYHFWTYLLATVEITVLFFIVEAGYNYCRQWWLTRKSK